MSEAKKRKRLEDDQPQDAIAEIIADYYYESVKQSIREETGVELSHGQTMELARWMLEQDLRRGIDPFWKGWGVYTKENTKLDEHGRVIWHILGDTITEKRYSDNPDEYPTSMKYNITYKEVQDARPDLLAWAREVRRKQQEAAERTGQSKRPKKNFKVDIPVRTREERKVDYSIYTALLKRKKQ